MKIFKYAYAACAGAVMVAGGTVLRADYECCDYTPRCWELHNDDPNYLCCYPPEGYDDCSELAIGYCFDTGGEWCT